MEEIFLQSLDIMWKGMLSIFAVIIVITLIVIVFQFFEKKYNNWLERKGVKANND